jgi:hypothetical protein
MLLSLDTRRHSAVATTPSRFYTSNAADRLVSPLPLRRGGDKGDGFFGFTRLLLDNPHPPLSLWKGEQPRRG